VTVRGVLPPFRRKKGSLESAVSSAEVRSCCERRGLDGLAPDTDGNFPFRLDQVSERTFSGRVL
jgi:hypothetical protein